MGKVATFPVPGIMGIDTGTLQGHRTHMTRILAILNYKGGTGKTTTVINLAAGLALRGERVLAVDLDPQGSIGVSLGVRHPRTISHAMLGHAPAADCIVPARENFDVIISDTELFQVEGELWRFNNDSVARRVLHHTLKPITDYDYILLDCSHAISLLTQNALLCARELLVPIAMDYLAMVGTRQVLQTLKTVGRIPGHQLRLTLVVPTMYHVQYRKDQEVMALLHRYFDGKVAEPIRSNVRVAEAASHQKTIFEYAPDSAGAVDYARLVERIANDVG